MTHINGINKDSAQKILNQSVPGDVLETYNQFYNIEENKIESYQKNGFIKLEKVLEVEALSYTNKLISAAVFLRKEQDKRSLQEKSEYEKSFLQCGYLCWDYKCISDFVLGKRFASIARDLMQVEHVRLWHDQALFKEPYGNATAVHQDCSYWPIAKPEYTITMWMALEDVSIDMGSLYFYPGTHDVKMKEYVDIFNNPHTPDSLVNKDKFHVSLKAGDVTFHSGLLFHGAGNNQTNILRKGMTVIYISDGSTFDSSDKRNATHTSCEGLKHGEIIDTKYTPIII
ncbi:MAG: phytanoyl-CoA dioxygenase family protein [Calditrichia bacterium]|nr:phytanoyl-CoA dioxygenase family protein [Calditrichia bacterium]